MQTSISLSDWLALPHEERLLLAQLFGVKKSQPMHVVNNGGTSVVSDGYAPADLGQVSVTNMIAFLGEDLKWYKEAQIEALLPLVLNKLHGKKDVPKKAKRGRPKSKAKEGEGQAESSV